MSEPGEPPADLPPDPAASPTDADLTPAQEFAQATRQGMPPLVWFALFFVEWSFGVAFLSLFSTAMFGFFSDAARGWAWYGGALVAAIGIPFGFLRFQLGKYSKAGDEESEAREDGVTMGVLGSFFAVGLIGLIVGFLLGGWLALICASIALSPFAPASWVGPGTSWIYVPLMVMGWTIGICVSVGLVLGIVLGLRGDVKRYPPRVTAPGGSKVERRDDDYDYD